MASRVLQGVLGQVDSAAIEQAASAVAAIDRRALDQMARTIDLVARNRKTADLAAGLSVVALEKQMRLTHGPLAGINEQLAEFSRAMEPGLGISKQLTGFSRAMEPGLGISKQLTGFSRAMEPGLGISKQLTEFSRAMELGLGISKQLTEFSRAMELGLGISKQLTEFSRAMEPGLGISKQLTEFSRAMEPGLGISKQLTGFSRAMEPGLGISKQLAEFSRAMGPVTDINKQLADSGKSRSRPAHQPRCAVRTGRPVRRIHRESLPTRASLRYRRSSRSAAGPTSRARCRAHGLGVRMKTTWYFDQRVLPKRPEIDPAWCLDVLADPLHTEVQTDGRIRFWGEVLLRGENEPRIIRVVTLEDGETIHNAFLDRDFRRAGTP